MSFISAGLRIAQGVAERSAGVSSASNKRIIGQALFEDAASGPLGKVQDRISTQVSSQAARLMPEPRYDLGHTNRQLNALRSHFKAANGNGLAANVIAQNPHAHVQKFAGTRARMPHLGAA